MLRTSIAPYNFKAAKEKKYGRKLIIHRILKSIFQSIGLIIIAIIIFGYETVSVMLTNPDKTLCGYKMEIVQTGSMEPTLPIGSLVLVKSQNDYKYGDIINFNVDNKGETMSYTHRISAIGNEGYLTKGDANNSDDPWMVNKGLINGKVIYHSIIVGQLVAYTRNLSLWNIIMVICVVIFIFLVLPVILCHCDKDEMEKEKKEKEVKRFSLKQRLFLIKHHTI